MVSEAHSISRVATYQEQQYTDQSAVLRATLNSLAMMNVANVINSKKHKRVMDEEDKITEDLKEILRLKKMQTRQQQKHNDEDGLERY